MGEKNDAIEEDQLASRSDCPWRRQSFFWASLHWSICCESQAMAWRRSPRNHSGADVTDASTDPGRLVAAPIQGRLTLEGPLEQGIRRLDKSDILFARCD